MRYYRTLDFASSRAVSSLERRSDKYIIRANWKLRNAILLVQKDDASRHKVSHPRNIVMRCASFPYYTTKCMPCDNKGTFQTDSRWGTPRICIAFPNTEKAIIYREEKLLQVLRWIEEALADELREISWKTAANALFVTVQLIQSFTVWRVVRSSSFFIVRIKRLLINTPLRGNIKVPISSS